LGWGTIIFLLKFTTKLYPSSFRVRRRWAGPESKPTIVSRIPGSCFARPGMTGLRLFGSKTASSSPSSNRHIHPATSPTRRMRGDAMRGFNILFFFLNASSNMKAMVQPVSFFYGFSSLCFWKRGRRRPADSGPCGQHNACAGWIPRGQSLRLGVVDAGDPPHELRHGHVVPGADGTYSVRTASARENDKVDVGGAGVSDGDEVRP